MISQKTETFPLEGLGGKINPQSFKEKWKRLPWIDFVNSVCTYLDWKGWVKISSEPAQRCPAWSAAILEVVSFIVDADWTHPWWIPPQVLVNLHAYTSERGSTFHYRLKQVNGILMVMLRICLVALRTALAHVFIALWIQIFYLQQ